MIWRLLIVHLSLISVIVSIFRGSHQITMRLDDTVEERKNGYFTIHFELEIIFFIDILFNCITEYRNEDRKMIRDVSKIIIRYLKATFILDLLATVPFTWWFDQDPDPNAYNYIPLLLLFKILRLKKT